MIGLWGFAGFLLAVTLIGIFGGNSTEMVFGDCDLAVSNELRGSWLEQSIESSDNEVKECRFVDAPSRDHLYLKIDTGDWGHGGFISERDELGLRMEPVMEPIRRLAMRLPGLKTVDVLVVAPAADRNDEYGNPRPGRPEARLVELSVDCDDLRHFRDISNHSTFRDVAVYVANRYLVSLNPHLAASWNDEVRAGAEHIRQF